MDFFLEGALDDIITLITFSVHNFHFEAEKTRVASSWGVLLRQDRCNSVSPPVGWSRVLIIPTLVSSNRQ